MKPELKNLFKFQSNKKSKQAIIDLGSNSVRMLIYNNFKISPIPVFNENLTMVPIEKDLIILEKLSKSEKIWLNNYHRTVFKKLIKSMNRTEALELQKACSAI